MNLNIYLSSLPISSTGMPLFRNVSTEALPGRRSSLRFKHEPIIYDEQGWETMPPAHTHYPTPPPSDVTSSSSTPAPVTEPTIRDPQTSTNKPSTRLRGKKFRADHIPRPRNSFICFRSELYKLKKKNPGGYDQNEISKEAGRVWALLTPEEQIPYKEMAKKEKEDHELRYPTYSYAPGKVKKAAATKRKTLAKGKQPSKKLRAIHLDVVDAVEPIALPSLPKFSSSLEDFRSTLPTPSPQPESPIWESPELLDLTLSNDESSLELNFDWSFIPTSSTSSAWALSPSSSADKKSEVYDLSIRPPSFDAIPEAFGFRPSLAPEEAAMDKLLPNMPSPQDILFFAHGQNDLAFHSPISISTHDNWDPVAITMSSQEGGYDYIDFGQSSGLDTLDDGYGSADMYAEIEAIGYAVSSTAPLEEARAEMSEFFNFNYHG